MQYAEATDAWLINVQWLDDGAQIPKIVAFNKKGSVVGTFESREYPEDEIPPDVLLRSRLIHLHEKGGHKPGTLADMLNFDISAHPQEIVGIGFYGNGHMQYLPVTKLQPVEADKAEDNK